jgi:uncharacterized membrane protein
MKNSKEVAKAAIAGILSLSTLTNMQQALAADHTYVKCYGIAAASKNDCGTVVSACAASIKTAAACYAWIYVPEGICTKIVNASVGKPQAGCVGPKGKPIPIKGE